MNKRVFLLLPVFVLVLILLILKISYRDKIVIDIEDRILLSDLSYNVIITNKSKSNIYFRGKPSLYSCRVYENEKVYYVTMPPIDDYLSGFIPFFSSLDIETEIETDTTRIFRVRGDVNNKKVLYEADKQWGIAASQYLGLCSDIHIILFFTRNPYKLNEYTEYVETLKKDGYAVLGRRVKNNVYFTITDTEIQVNDDVTNDHLLLFIRKYLYPPNSSSRSLRDILRDARVAITIFFNSRGTR
jgi:hypothetical protein